ncbi:hypothetical protein HN51_016437 [Arachis hypogaea]
MFQIDFDELYDLMCAVSDIMDNFTSRYHGRRYMLVHQGEEPSTSRALTYRPGHMASLVIQQQTLALWDYTQGFPTCEAIQAAPVYPPVPLTRARYQSLPPSGYQSFFHPS